jgi:hypothetical protein
LKAGVDVHRKFVFHVDNVCLGTTTDDINKFLNESNIKTETCFTAKSWMRGEELEQVCAFRVCVRSEFQEKILDESLWPTGVMIRPWQFKARINGVS